MFAKTVTSFFDTELFKILNAKNYVVLALEFLVNKEQKVVNSSISCLLRVCFKHSAGINLYTNSKHLIY